MAYAQDTITSANAANDFVNVLDGLLTTAGWTTVETLTPSGNFRNRVYLSPGTSNLCGYDWYIGVSWTTVGTENFVRVIGFEDYNAGTHVASGLCGARFDQNAPNSSYVTGRDSTGYTSTTTINMSTATILTTTVTLLYLSGSSTSQYATIPGFQTLIPSSAFGYWMSVTLDHVALWTTVATNVNHAVISSLIMDDDYVASGLFDVHPVVAFTSQSFEMSSHIIGIAPTTTAYTAVSASYSKAYGAKLPALSDTYLDAFAWQPYVYLDWMQQGSANPTPGTQINGMIVVGQIPDYLLVWGGSIGDTVTVDSATYVLSPQLGGSTNAQPTVAVLVE